MIVWLSGCLLDCFVVVVNCNNCWVLIMLGFSGVMEVSCGMLWVSVLVLFKVMMLVLVRCLMIIVDLISIL